MRGFTTAGLLLIVLAWGPGAVAQQQEQAPTNASHQATFLNALKGMHDQLLRTPDAVVAEIGNQTITSGDVAQALLSLPPIYGQHDLNRIFEDAVNGLLAQRALVIRATEKGIDRDPVARDRIEALRTSILANEYVRRMATPKITEDMIKQAYEGTLAKQPGADEVQVRVIMVQGRDQADAVSQRLAAGADFAEVATQFSKDPTAAAGGELGFVNRGAMLPDLAAVMFALAPGQITQFPVPANGSFYFVKVEARRQLPPPTLDAVRGQIVAALVQQQVPALIQDALKGLPVHRYGPTGKPAH
jgi:peptidyl-prolyl cis-trans isomerase C